MKAIFEIINSSKKMNKRLEKTILRALRILFSCVSFVFWKNWEFKFSYFEIYLPLVVVWWADVLGFTLVFFYYSIIICFCSVEMQIYWTQLLALFWHKILFCSQKRTGFPWEQIREQSTMLDPSCRSMQELFL